MGFCRGDLSSEKWTRICALFMTPCLRCWDRRRSRNSWSATSLKWPRWPGIRGCTLNDAFIILDESQNTTIEQMKMFLTRIGFNSKAVITGDVTQIDLAAPHEIRFTSRH
ncbi:PhoH family protein [Pantoea ananatis]